MKPSNVTVPPETLLTVIRNCTDSPKFTFGGEPCTDAVRIQVDGIEEEALPDERQSGVKRDSVLAQTRIHEGDRVADEGILLASDGRIGGDQSTEGVDRSAEK